MSRPYLKFAAIALAISSRLASQSLADDLNRTGVALLAGESAIPTVDLQIKSGYLRRWYTEDDDETRILLLRVAITSRASEPITIRQSNWTLTAETRELSAISMPPELTRLSVAVNGERLALNSVKTRNLTLEPRQEESTWLIFKNVPDGDQVPEMMLTCNLADQTTVQVDIDQAFAKRLKLRHENIGPANAIALLTIDGSLDTVNAGTLARKIDLLSTKQIYRVIVNFGPRADVPDNNVAGWLRRVAIQSGGNPVVDDNFPSLTSVIDLHYVDRRSSTETEQKNDEDIALPDPFEDDAWNGPSRNTHQHLVEAVDSAIAPLCEMVSREELVRSIRDADNLTKAAVLRHGAERLVDTHLPTILALTNDRNPAVAGAAVFALRRSGDPAAIQTLVTIAKADDTVRPESDADTAPTQKRAIAVQSLAASKYAVAHSEVLGLLSIDDPVLRVTTAQAIAANPRPAWSEPLATLFQKADAADRAELLPALAAVGHPRLLTVLAECLASNEPRLSAKALDLIIGRQEPVAEQLASEWMLKHLELSSPSTQVLAFLRRTRDHRAVPLLLKHLEKKSIDRHDLLLTVLTIGDHRIIEQISADFDSYDTREQLLILKALGEVRSDQFWKLTESVIQQPIGSSEKSLEGVVELLRRNGNDRAVSLLIDLLSRLSEDVNRHRRHFAGVCAALSSTGTPAARDALRDITRNSEEGSSIAKASLAQLYQRSPAYSYVSRGSATLRSGNIKSARLFLEAAVKTDPELPAARLWRGNVVLHTERPSDQELETARTDFARYVELEPDDTEGHTGLALVLVRQGAIESGIAAGMIISQKSNADSVYLYNMACVYGRAIEYLEAHPDETSPEQKSQIEPYRSKGIELLQQSIDNGLDDDNLSWMQQDPDLETIRLSPAFKQLVEKTLGKGEDAPDSKDANEEVKLPKIPAELQPK